MNSVDIDSLSDEQAQQAAVALFESLKSESWEGPQPSWDDVRALHEDLDDAHLSAEERASIDGLWQGDPGRSAAMAREMLRFYAQQPELAPSVQRAVSAARKRDLVAPPLLAGALVLLLLTSVSFRFQDETVEQPTKDGTVKKRKRIIKLDFHPPRSPTVVTALLHRVLG